MASPTTLNHECVFDLDGSGEGGFLRVRMTNRDGELNRHVMKNQGKKSLVIATLLDTAHGKMKEGGDDATLLIACFRFLPYEDERFRSAVITWTFSSDDPTIQVDVENIAPLDSWSLNTQTLEVERNFELNATGGVNAAPATFSLGGKYGGKQATKLEYYTTVDGTMLKLDRDTGGFDSVRWSLYENKIGENGICRMLQVGVLLRRTALAGKNPRQGPPPIFRGVVDIDVDKGKRSNFKKIFQKTEIDDAIMFQPGTDRVSGQFEIKKNGLEAINLRDDIMNMSLHTSFEDLRKEREEKKRKKREEEETKKNEQEEEKKKEEEEKKKKEEEEKKKKEEGEKKKKQEEEVRNTQDKQTAAITGAGVDTHSIAPVQSGVRTVSESSQPPVWLFYVVLGVLGMYLWQQLVKLLSGGK